MVCIEGYNVQVPLFNSKICDTGDLYHRQVFYLVSLYSCLCFLSTQSRTALERLYHNKISHVQPPVPATLVAKFAFYRTECPICSGQTDHLELRVMGRIELCIIGGTLPHLEWEHIC